MSFMLDVCYCCQELMFELTFVSIMQLYQCCMFSAVHGVVSVHFIIVAHLLTLRFVPTFV